jgi:hypothetical protein
MGGVQCALIVAIAVIVATLITQRKVSGKAPAEGFKVTRGCVISDGTVIYEVEITNELPSVVNNVTVTLMAYPKNCVGFTGQEKITIPMVESDKSEKVEFRFNPTTDHV